LEEGKVWRRCGGNMPPWVDVAALVVAEAERATDRTPDSPIEQ
jgi:hypothetical protein